MSEMSGISIAALELETGIGKDTLRIWERRYGFPQPARDAKGERLYPPEQVAQLRDVRRLLDQGMRPGQVFSLSLDERSERARPPAPEGEDPGLLQLLRRHDEAALREELRMRLARDGMADFVANSVSPMLVAIGNAWVRGEIEIFEEHFFSEQLQGVLHEAIARLPQPGSAPRILLATPPGEPHGLGLLLVQALLRLEGAVCIPLGVQTPESQVLAAAAAYGAQVVALSYSENFGAGPTRESVRRLRAALPEEIALWCGGGAVCHLKRPPRGVAAIRDLDTLRAELARWRDAQGPQPA